MMTDTVTAAGRLGVIAGRGTLPRRIVDRCRTQGRGVFVLAFEGHTDPETTTGVDHVRIGLGRVGAGIEALKQAGVRDIVMAGGIDRPSLRALDLDKRGMKLLMKLGLRGRGDDALLRVLIGELESEGFRVVGVPDLLDDALMPEGLLGRHGPDGQAQADIARGLAVLQRIGAADVGQAVVVQQGLVLAVEAIEGTDAMLSRCRELARPGPGGVLVKLRKPGQENRADLPTIGPATVRKAAAAGLRGVAAEAGGAVVIGRDDLVAEADAAGLFVTGINQAGRAAGGP